MSTEPTMRRLEVRLTSPTLRRLAHWGANRAPAAWSRASPTLFGIGFALALGEERRRVRENLRALLGPRPWWAEELDAVRTFASFAHCLTESLAAGSPRAASARRRVQGAEHLRAALARGRGVVLVTAHTGAWDAAAVLLGRDFGVEVTVAMAREPDRDGGRVHDRFRELAGVHVVHVGEGPLDALGLAARLREGGVVALQIDRAPDGMRTVDVQGARRTWRVPAGPFALAAAAGAPVVPVFVRRVGHFDYELQIRPAIHVERRPSPEVLAAAAGRATAEMEAFLRAHPTQWFHFRAR